MSELKIISWNIWFDPFEQMIRYNEIFKICHHYLPDIICFQEVMIPFLQYLQKYCVSHPDFANCYLLSDDFSGNSILPYGVLTLAKKELSPSFAIFPFPTNMARKLLRTVLTLPNREQIAVGNVHLESLGNATLREQQLAICDRELRKYPHYILCGDFNFCSYRNYGDVSTPEYKLENHCLTRSLPSGKDMWSILYGNTTNKGYTFNGKENDLIPNKKEIMRYDPIMYATLQGTNMLTPQSMEILGTEPIGADESTTNTVVSNDPFASPPATGSNSKIVRSFLGRELLTVYPSDHYGLFGSFHFSEGSNQQSNRWFGVFYCK